MDQGWVALLRGINLGSRNAVPMAGLREVFGAAGCSSVRTYIRSGNVVFRTRASTRAALAKRLERAVAEAFDVDAAVVLRTVEEIAKVASSHPFGRNTSTTHVAFLVAKPAPESVHALAKVDITPDRIEVVGREVFLHYPNGVGGAHLTGALLERHIGVQATIRNWRTVVRLAAMAAEEMSPT